MSRDVSYSKEAGIYVFFLHQEEKVSLIYIWIVFKSVEMWYGFKFTFTFFLIVINDQIFSSNLIKIESGFRKVYFFYRKFIQLGSKLTC